MQGKNLEQTVDYVAENVDNLKQKVEKTIEPRLQNITKTVTAIREKTRGSPLGLFGTIFAVCGIAGVLDLGPLDLCRSFYNTIIGDAPALKRQIVDYLRQRVSYTADSRDRDVEATLAQVVGVSYGNLVNGRLDPDTASMSRLWDEAEEYTPRRVDRWLWHRLDSYMEK